MSTDIQAMKKAANWLHYNGPALTEALRVYTERMHDNAAALNTLANEGGNGYMTATAATELAADYKQREQRGAHLQNELYELLHNTHDNRPTTRK